MYYNDIVNLSADALNELGITKDVIDNSGYDNMFDFFRDRNIVKTYLDNYDDFYWYLSEYLMNHSDKININDDEFENTLETAVYNFNNYDAFKRELLANSDLFDYFNVDNLPDTEEEFFNMVYNDKNLYEDIMRCLYHAILYDSPDFGLYFLNDYDFTDDVYRSV